MRLLCLEFEAIGPFPGKHRIDLEALGAGGLFLLEGPTGAGKTTIIDAIVFALYGDVAGGVSSSKDRLVSTHRNLSATPFVQLTFETGNGIWQVYRTPSHTRPKQKGTGVKEENSTCRLYKIAAPGAEPELVSSNIKEAAIEVQRAVGLTKEQFTQTIILPQGQFAAFLKANPDDRRNVLQDIFGTHFYEDVQNELRTQAKQYHDEVNQAQSNITATKQTFANEAWEPNQIPENLDHECADQRLSIISDDVKNLDELRLNAIEKAKLTDAKLAEEVDLQKRLQERSELKQENIRLAAGSAAVDLLRNELDLARRAASTRTAFEILTGASERNENARTELAVAKEKATTITVLAPWAQAVPDLKLSSLQEAIAEWNVEQGKLQELAVLEKELAPRQVDLEKRQKHHSKAAADLAAATAAQQDQDTFIKKTDAALSKAQEAAADLAEAKWAAQQDRERHVKHLELAKLREKSEQLKLAVTAATATAKKANLAHDRAHKKWVDSTAGRLASELVSGKACPVCGGIEHPLPAVLVADEEVTQEQVQSLREEISAADIALATAATQYKESMNHVEIVTAALGSETIDIAQQRITASKKRVTAAESATKKVSQLTADLKKAREDAVKADKKLALRREQFVAESTAIEQLQEKLQQDRLKVAAAAIDGTSVAAYVTELKCAITYGTQLLNAVSAIDSCKNELARADDSLNKALIESGFSTNTAAREALRDTAAIAQLELNISEHDNALRDVKSRLSAPRIAQLITDTCDVETALDNATKAQEIRDQAIEEHARAATRLATLTQAHKTWLAADEELAKLAQTSKPYVDMSELAQGNNPHNLTLATYVLLQRFEEIVDRANSRLISMTSGRYEFIRSGDRQGRTKRAGLGLAVVDHASGDQQRSPSTLSGGETFLASLALALGLAEAVTSEAGGIELKTLFIDEGFGTLDPETLDLVMQQLGKLHSGGRAVGIISHVAELKQQITSRICVKRLQNGGGSTLSSTLDS
ncbi:MAG: AAA family ATPase [Propionibacteriaceae bacterium]